MSDDALCISCSSSAHLQLICCLSSAHLPLISCSSAVCLLLQVGRDVISLITTRANVDELLKLNDVIDLVIPRGSNALVTHIQQNTKIAALGHADGICHIYIDPDCDIDMACKICIDSKMDYPAACNAVEKILVHEALAKDGRVRILTCILPFVGKASAEVLNQMCIVKDPPKCRCSALLLLCEISL